MQTTSGTYVRKWILVNQSNCLIIYKGLFHCISTTNNYTNASYPHAVPLLVLAKWFAFLEKPL